MRCLLCKARTNDGKYVVGYPFVMVYDGYECACISTEPLLSLEGTRQDLEWSFIDENTLCRYIGKNDIGGNRIFENDIVKYWVSSERTSVGVGVILYDSENCCYRIKDLVTSQYADGLLGMYTMAVQGISK